MKVEGWFIDNCHIGVHPPLECSKITKQSHLKLGFSRFCQKTFSTRAGLAIGLDILAPTFVVSAKDIAVNSFTAEKASEIYNIYVAPNSTERITRCS